MAELKATDLSTYTKGRLPANDDTQGLLDAALSAARRWCGWSVCPVQTDMHLDVDGPGGRVLSLPTLKLIEVSSVTETGVALDVAKLDVSRSKGTIQKYPHGLWTSRAGGVKVTITHGFTESEAADWRRAVLRLADLMDRDDAQRDSSDLVKKKIDDVEYMWAAGLIDTDERLKALFSQYRILPAP